MREPDATTVAIVGAGLSGLIAARELQRRDVAFLVLEAADRTGGRAMSATTALGSRVDLGGQWIGHDHHRIAALAAELGATPFRMHTKGVPTLLDDERRVSLASPSMLLAVIALVGVEALTRLPTPRRRRNTTVASLLKKVPGVTARRLLGVLADVSWTADLDKMTVDSMVNMIRRQGGLRTMLSTAGGAQDTLVEESIGSLTDHLASEVGPRIRTGRRVTAIVQDDAGVTVATTDGEVRASKVIVTVPPPLARRIRFDPPLPMALTALQETTYMGSVFKGIAVYEAPFWRERGGGEFIVLDAPGRAVFDSGAPGGPGHLVILVGGPTARLLDDLDPAKRRAMLLDDLVPHVGREVLEPASWHEKSWHLDENAGGGYLALAGPGSPAELPFPHAPIDHIHWAGTETAHDHPGYLDGAIEAGLRATGEIDVRR
ncbi:MAG: FAD-dependent oxidoreductase [bacterium]|nr:FAD-dependent oxidoreductase [bacterium]